ncbi:phosphate ABC transporter permease PstA [Pseudokineococcus lusitanus]|uniref:Phosphate transport system permease protein PstA n=1 Tax=Pseudokineococcus lusitanus TaxID=763993 RepID=A0A3N1HJZ6_9ACTN|nr:phosphate ABC transporter permease PstA [Pseudokineococcus lusitanus]ROP42826.1 phosphate transport system permease protein [Pseudokineococcus lusitanus]
MSRTSPPPAAPSAPGVPGTTPPGPRPTSLGSGSGRLPRWAPAGAVGLAVLLAVALAVTGTSAILAAVVGAAVATLLLVGASRAVEGPRRATDRFVTCLVTIAFAVALAPLLSLLFTVISRGARRLDGEFLTFSMLGVVGEGGGAYHAMMGTLIITLIATLISVPIGVMTAIYLVEYGGGKLARWITFLVDVMTGIPSIVAGLFAIALFTLFFGPGVRMGVIGSVALSVLMIPIVVRSVEEMLKIVPAELREAAYALGVPKWLTIVKVVLPTAVSGIASGITIAIARVIGETAPLLVTVGITTGLNLNPFDGRMATLPVYAYYQFTQPGVPAEAAIDRAWTAALLLIIIVMLLNVVARVVARALAPKGAR